MSNGRMNDSDEEEDTVQVWRLQGFASRETRAGISRRWTSVLRSFTMLAEEYNILGAWHAFLNLPQDFSQRLYYYFVPVLDDK